MARTPTLLVLLMCAVAGATESGRPFMTLYTSKEIKGHTQFWAIIQDDRGVMYLGDGFGVQEFDGANWRAIINPNSSFGRSLARDSLGRIYVGSSAMLGYLAPDHHGEMQYRSLLEFLRPEDRLFNYVWSVQAAPEGIYYQTHERLFRFNPVTDNNGSEQWQVKVWHPQNTFGYTFWCDRTLYVQQFGVGLMKMVRDSLVLLSGGEQFANDRIHVMLPFPGKKGNYIFGTFARGLFEWDGSRFRPFPTEADTLLQQGTLYSGVITPDSCFALGTMSNGLIILDREGRIKNLFNQGSGLLSNTVSCLYVDREKNLWAGMDGGVAVLEYDSPLSQFSIPGGTGPSDFCRYQGVLYITANDGVYYLDRADGRFKLVAGIAGNAQSFFFSVINEELFVTVAEGIHRVQGKRAMLVLPNQKMSSSVITMSKVSLGGNLLVGGQIDGAILIQYDARNPRRLSRIGKVAGTYEYIRLAVESEPGIIWLGTMDNGLIRLTFSRDRLMDPVVQKFATDAGLPEGSASPFKVGNRLIFGTKKGIYQFDPVMQKFSPDPFFNDVHLGRNPDEGVVATDTQGNLWINLGKESAVYNLLADGSYQLEKGQLARFADEGINAIFPENDRVVWFGTANAVIRYAPGQHHEELVPFPALIRRVVLAGDSTVYDGVAWPGSALADPTARSFLFRLNALRFEFSATSYLNPRATEFRTRLEGFDQNWSSWNKDTRRDYTNLPAGKYHFRVRARNIFQQESSEDIFAFTIQPSWYQTWWAWCLYILGAGGLIFGLVRLRTRQLHARSRELEEMVRDRTDKIKETQEKLITQSKLAALGALTAGIAHEIKNPLNFVNNFAALIMDLTKEMREVLTGKTEKMQPDDRAAIDDIMDTLEQNAAKIIEHGNRADNIVKSMLQHSRGKSDERQLTDINGLLAQDINLAYHGMRAQDSSFNVKIETTLDPAVGQLNIVPQDISRVFLNIISNGCYEVHRKRMEQGGDFTPTLSIVTRDLGDRIEVRIRDNGYGIPAAVGEKLFTPFFTTKPPGKGSGLGLSISYDIIVHQHSGQLTFTTEEGHFAEFLIHLPK
jgi:signal transduction histidine kinase